MPIRCLRRPSLPDSPCPRAAPSTPMSFVLYMRASPSLDRLFGIRQTVVQAAWPALSARPGRPVLLTGNGTEGFLEFLGGTCDLLGDSCGQPELPRRDADQALEVMAELTLVRKAGAGGDFRQGGVALSQELLRPFNPAGDDVLVRRQSSGRLELPREVVGAEVGDRRQLVQSQAGVEVFLDVFDDGMELPLSERTGRSKGRAAWGGGVADQLDSEQVGQRLRGETATGGGGRQVVIHCQHPGAQVWGVLAGERAGRPARGVELERLGGDPCDQLRLQEDVEGVRVTAPAPPGRAAGAALLHDAWVPRSQNGGPLIDVEGK